MIMTVMKIKMMIKMVDSSISPSPPGGNQVDGLPPAVSSYIAIYPVQKPDIFPH